MRLGFSVKVYGRADLVTAATQAGAAHLSLRLAQLRDVLGYLRDKGITMYRMHTDLAPWPEEGASAALGEVEACAGQLEALGEEARAGDVRLSFHPYSRVVLNAPNEEQAADSSAYLEVLAALLDGMQLGREAVIVLHVGGVYDDAVRSAERFVQRYEGLPEGVRARVALENDDHRFGFYAVRGIHARCGVPLVFDLLHHQVYAPGREPWQEALAQAVASWPEGVTPKMHYATPRTELRMLPGTGRIKPPSWTEHSDYVNPFAFVEFARAAQALGAPDIMLECKARDLALLQLRRDLATYALDLAATVR